MRRRRLEVGVAEAMDESGAMDEAESFADDVALVGRAKQETDLFAQEKVAGVAAQPAETAKPTPAIPVNPLSPGRSVPVELVPPSFTILCVLSVSNAPK